MFFLKNIVVSVVRGWKSINRELGVGAGGMHAEAAALARLVRVEFQTGVGLVSSHGWRLQLFGVSVCVFVFALARMGALDAASRGHTRREITSGAWSKSQEPLALGPGFPAVLGLCYVYLLACSPFPL